MTSYAERIAELEQALAAQAATLAAMQRRTRYLRRGLAVLAILLGGAFWGAVQSGAQTPTPTDSPKGTPAVTPVAAAPNTVQAARFEVVDAAGKVLAVLGAEGDAGVLKMNNDKGKPLVLLGPHRTGSGDGSVTTFNRDGDVLVNIGATSQKDGSISTFNARGQELVNIGATDKGIGAMITYNANAQQMVMLAGAPEGGLMVAFNEAGTGVVKIGVREEASGIIEVWGGNGVVRSLDPLGETAAPQ